MNRQTVSNDITYLNEPAPVSMADAWFDYGTNDHFWVKHRNAVFDRHFQSIVKRAEKIGEIGCGCGFVLSHLQQQYRRPVDGFELNLHALELCPKLEGNLYVYDIFQRHPDLVAQYDLLLMMDVLEHIEDEAAFLAATYDHLKPGGYLIIAVPTRQHLYSAYDVAAGHHRRYSDRRLRAVTAAAGLTVHKTVHWGHCYLPILMLRQLLIKDVSEDEAIKQGFAVSSIMNWCMSQLRWLDLLPTFGITGTAGLIVAQKPSST
ncbi:class I SAM-dependent methyltransferase [filamentous cyanobacterium LEGE 11480]|uniref:Class I SAM-dependent methyltransferase n=1 Tax=Romeriopsis navalis LEGE 11480 TaxID=2777977 RepID=A0A928VPR8_9CYAN|nr:class I SAM-dependent methyltransferase [Romeriopsis navalis]MBE9029879.1 class I SAM-dependent methyltransferase [Romeriopsis navalis LEGE 11480]